MTKEHTIDAAGRSLGRVASEVAVVLMGKNLSDFVKHLPGEAKVTVINAAQVKVTGAKLEQKDYIRYTGYPGGLRKRTLTELITKKGYEEVIRKAVRGMLPPNKLRPIMMKNLKVTD